MFLNRLFQAVVWSALVALLPFDLFGAARSRLPANAFFRAQKRREREEVLIREAAGTFLTAQQAKKL
jgi:hypothetical protein